MDLSILFLLQENNIQTDFYCCIIHRLISFKITYPLGKKIYLLFTTKYFDFKHSDIYWIFTDELDVNRYSTRIRSFSGGRRLVGIKHFLDRILDGIESNHTILRLWIRCFWPAAICSLCCMSAL